MALVEGCTHALEISVPAQEVESETARVVVGGAETGQAARASVRVKRPLRMIRKYFAGDIRQRVLEALIPKHLQKQFEAENLNVVGTPDITEVHLHEGEPLRFKAEFEVIARDRTERI